MNSRTATPRLLIEYALPTAVARIAVGHSSSMKTWNALEALTPRHQFRILTKRPKRLASVLADPAFYDQVHEAIGSIMNRFNSLLPVDD